MADRSFDAPEKIGAILQERARLRFLLTETYGLELAAITRIRVDGDNIKLDIWAGERMLRFKAKGTSHVLRPDPGSGILSLVMDPALAQALYEIAADFAS